MTTMSIVSSHAAKSTSEVRTTHQFKELLVERFRAALALTLAEAGVTLKGPQDVETRHALKGALRAVMEIVADAGWGWRYAQADAGSAVNNVFSFRSRTKAAGAAGVVAAATEGDEEKEDEDEDEDAAASDDA